MISFLSCSFRSSKGQTAQITAIQPDQIERVKILNAAAEQELIEDVRALTVQTHDLAVEDRVFRAEPSERLAGRCEALENVIPA
jgi:hypothetical protein